MPYTQLAEPDLQHRIDQDLAYLTGEIRRLVPARRLAAIVLGGGYGRGDGGVRRTPQGPAPYNDYDLFVVIRGGLPWRRRSLRRAVALRRPDWESAVDLEVEVALCTEAQLRRSPLTLRLFDLASGHRVLWGDASVGKVFDPHRGGVLPLVEGARLLVNRGSLLAFCKAQRATTDAFPPEEHARVIRYLHKAILACGDVVLMHGGCYTTHSDARMANLHKVSGPSPEIMAELRAWYAHVVESRRGGRETVPAGCPGLEAFFERVWHRFEQVHLWFESERLEVKPLRWTDYVIASFNKFPVTAWPARVADRLRAAYYARGASHVGPSLRYGRENVLAGWLAELLYLGGQPAVATLEQQSPENWEKQFSDYWAEWSLAG